MSIKKPIVTTEQTGHLSFRRRRNIIEIILSFLLRRNDKMILFFLSIFIPIACFSQNDTVLMPPSIEVKLDKNAWHKYIGSLHPEGALNMATYEYGSNKAIKMIIFSDVLLITKDSANRYINFYCDTKKRESGLAETYEKNGFTVVKYPGNSPRSNGTRTFCELFAIHPEGYKAAIYFEAPLTQKAKMDSLVDDFLDNVHIVSVNYIDEKLGYPYQEQQADSLVRVRNKELTKRFRETYPLAQLDDVKQDEIYNEAKKTIDTYISTQFSWKKFYSTRKKIYKGALSIDDWLNYKFMGTENDYISFLKTFGGINRSTLSDVFNMALAKHFGDTLAFAYVGQPLEITIGERKIYWSYAVPIKPLKDTATFMVFSFAKDSISYKWDVHRTMFPKFIEKSDEGSDFTIVKHSTGEDEYDNITADYIVFTNNSGKYLIGNNTLPASNLMKQKITIPDSGTYKMIAHGVDLANGKLKVSDIICTEMVESPDFLIYPPDKRLYESVIQFEDLNNDGATDAFFYAVSNGKLVQVQIVTTSATGVKILPADNPIKEKIIATELFKKIARESTQKATGFK